LRSTPLANSGGHSPPYFLIDQIEPLIVTVRDQNVLLWKKRIL